MICYFSAGSYENWRSDKDDFPQSVLGNTLDGWEGEKWLDIANEAHKRGLSVGLKNDVDQIIELEPYYDFSVNEECHAYNECEKMQPFIDANKPVFNAEYKQEYVDNSNSERDIMCAEAIALQFQTLVLPLDLDDSFRYSCE